jgi:SAM-dependent methyltransferase
MLSSKFAGPVKRFHRVASMNFGRAGSSKPLSVNWGFEHGTPIDRYYIERFLEGHSADVKGRVLEVQEDGYSCRFGGERVEQQDILHLDDSNPRATIVGDLADPATLPKQAFDCVILTQTLHLVFDVAAALSNVREALRPGGAALITVPGITPLRQDGPDRWYWSPTEGALQRLLSRTFDSEKVSVESFGNLFAATAFLHGAAVEDVAKSKLEQSDPAYPVTIAARAIA